MRRLGLRTPSMRQGWCRPLRRACAAALVGALSTTLSQPASAHDLTPPRLVGEPTAPWPGRAETHDVVVPLLVTVSPTGTVEEVSVEATVSPAFDDAAVKSARRFSFEPARRDGRNVSARVRVAVRFLGDAAAGAPEAARVEAPALGTAAPSTMVAATDREVRVQGASPPRSASEATRDRDVLGAAPHKTASELLRVAPGVFVSQHSGEGKAHQIFLRGFDAVHGQDLELWVGGIPVNEVSNIHGQGYADLHFAMPEVIKEIQSTPGTYDPRQGDFAVAGSIRMKLGLAEPGITTKGTLGSFGTRRLFLAYHPREASDETFAAFEEYTTDGFGPNRAARRGSFMGQVTHDFGEGLAARLLATTSAGRFDSPGVVRLRDIERGALDRFGTYDPNQGGASSRTQLLLELHKDEDGAKWALAPFVIFRGLSLRQNFTGFLVESQRGGAERIDSDNTQQLQDAVTTGATASYRRNVAVFSKRDAFEVGFYGRTDWIDQSQRRLAAVGGAPTETLVDAKVRATNVAGYLDGALHPLRRLALRGGVRVDALSFSAQDRLPQGGVASAGAERTAQGAHFGKKLTADVLVVPALHAVASYGEGFRSPQARSLASGERTPFTEVKSYEAGVRYGDGLRLQGSLAAFHTRLTDDLAFDEQTARNERAPATQRTGAAIELVARPRSFWTSSVSATYTRASFTNTDARFVAGDLLPYVPQLVIRADTAIRGRLWRVAGRELEGRVGYGIEALARRPLPYGEFGKNLFVLDASTGLRLREVELGVDVTNVFDTAHYDGEFVFASNFVRGAPAELVPQRHVTVGPPRALFASLTLHL